MKKFICKILIVSSLTIVVGVLFFILFLQLVSSKIRNIQFEKSITEIYIGDSHIQCAIVDTMLLNSKNCANSSECYYYSYYKLKHLINTNPSIKTVYLGYNYHSLSDYFDEYIYGINSSSVASKYFFILPNNEKIKMLVGHLDNFPDFLKRVIKEGVSIFILNGRSSFVGGYSNQFSNTVAVSSSMEKRINHQFYNNEYLTDVSSINLSYLNKIIHLCEKNNIKLILLSTPLHSYYKSKIPSKYISTYSKAIESNNIQVIDLSSLRLTDDCYIPDGDHVSSRGALLITNEFEKIKTERVNAYNIKVGKE